MAHQAARPALGLRIDGCCVEVVGATPRAVRAASASCAGGKSTAVRPPGAGDDSISCEAPLITVWRSSAAVESADRLSKSSNASGSLRFGFGELGRIGRVDERAPGRRRGSRAPESGTTARPASPAWQSRAPTPGSPRAGCCCPTCRGRSRERSWRPALPGRLAVAVGGGGADDPRDEQPLAAVVEEAADGVGQMSVRRS